MLNTLLAWVPHEIVVAKYALIWGVWTLYIVCDWYSIASLDTEHVHCPALLPMPWAEE